MPLVDMHDLLKHAYRNHYAVGSFRSVDLESMGAIIAAAENGRSPVILNLADRHPEGGTFARLAAAAERSAQDASVPVAIQYEDGQSPDSVVRAINAGCNGVALAAVHDSFPAHVSHTRDQAEMAHACGVSLEAGPSPAGGEGVYTTVEEARAFVQRTRVDSLVVYVGTGNGRVRGRAKLDVERLKRLNEAVQVPLTIRAENGFADEQCHKLLQHGVAHVRFPDQLEVAAGDALRALGRREPRGGYSELMLAAREAMQAEVERSLHRLGSAGRAAEVLVQCRAWRPIQHVIVYNVEGATDSQVEAMMAQGRETLGRIPGVRRVFTGWALQDRPQYRYCWLVEFVHEKVIDSYRDHPDHVAFANQLFRPIAGDRVSIDFQEAGSDPVSVAMVGVERARA